MAQGEKPYRVYRGGRVKGRVPTLPKPERAESKQQKTYHHAGHTKIHVELHDLPHAKILSSSSYKTKQIS